MKQIINCETGKVIERKLNAEELTQEAIDNAIGQKTKAITDAEAKAKAQAKAAILDRIGLTADEAKLLLG